MPPIRRPPPRRHPRRSTPLSAATPQRRLRPARDTQLDRGEHDGKTLIPAKNLAPQIIRPQIAYLLSDMMADVIRHGTGVSARSC